MTSTLTAPASRSAAVARWRWTTVAIPDPASSLLACLPAAADTASAVAWVQDGDGVVGWGEVARVAVRGADRFREADAAWSALVATFEVDDSVAVPGTGPVAFTSMPFADDSADSGVLLVPRVVVGRRGATWWLTTAEPASASQDVDASLRDRRAPRALDAASLAALVSSAQAAAGPGAVTFRDGSCSPAQWMEAVSSATQRIRAGEVDKVVLARDLVARTARHLDVRWLLSRLADAYPTCWTFAVGGLVGATPELLVRHEDGLVHSRVLAGTVGLSGDVEVDAQRAASLARSAKDRAEHEFAVASVVAALAANCHQVSAPDVPFVLRLPNVAHLASDVTATPAPRDDGSTASLLALASDLHPTAAVCGTPTVAAGRLIGALEAMDRGRYAGPVGWVDAAGNGELGLALRSAQLGADGRSARLFAGCGIVAGSDPAAELAESEAKFVPVREALGDTGRQGSPAAGTLQASA